MNEEERSNLYIYTYSDLDDDFVFAETKYTLGDLHKLQKKNQHLQELISNNKRISTVAEKRYEKILELEEKIKKYKSLYENEKDHTDTLRRIIKKIEEYIEELYDNNDDTTCYDIDKNCKREILDLLKEIKLYEKI